MVLDGSASPRISYRDYDNHLVKYAAWNGSGWDIGVVEASNAERGTSLALGADGTPHIVYQGPPKSFGTLCGMAPSGRRTKWTWALGR